MPPESFHTKLIKIIRTVLIENDSLSIFMNNFSIGKLNSNGSYIANWKIKFTKDPDKNTAEYSVDPLAIRICKLSPKDLTIRSIEDNDGSRASTKMKRYFFRNIFNCWDERFIAKQVGINVCRQVNIKGYILNYLDVKKVMVDNIASAREMSYYIASAREMSYYSSSDVIHTFYFAGTKNSFLAASTVNGLLYIREQMLEKMIATNDADTVKRCIKNLLVCYKQLLDKYIDVNMKTFRDEVCETIEQNAISRIVHNDLLSSRYIRNTSESRTPEQLTNEIQTYINNQINAVTDNNSIFGVNDSYSYMRLINEILNTKMETERETYKNGFQKGMRIGLKMEMLGWKPTSKKFLDESASSVWWEKEITIIPETFIFRDERYTIPLEHRMFKITKLYLNQDGKMKAEGNHPNVSHGKVCMGDLRIVIEDELSDIQDMLKKAEELLDIINYDSAYNNEKREFLLQNSIKCQLLTAKHEDDKTKKKKTSHIRELTDLSSDDSDDEEEIIEDSTPKTIVKDIKSKNVVIAQMIQDPQPVVVQENDRYGLAHELETDRLNTADTESIRPVDVPTYISNTETDIGIVQSDGERRPLIFVAGPGSSNTSIVSTVDGELSLGDSNLIIVGDN